MLKPAVWIPISVIASLLLFQSPGVLHDISPVCCYFFVDDLFPESSLHEAFAASELSQRARTKDSRITANNDGLRMARIVMFDRI